MSLLSLTCNHCGAPLSVPEETRFVTCQFCAAQLEVKHEGNAVFTHVASIDRSAADIARNLETIRLQNELEQLDRDLARDEKAKEGASGCAVVFRGMLEFGLLACLTAGMLAAWHVTGYFIFAILACGGPLGAVVSFYGVVRDVRDAGKVRRRYQSTVRRREKLAETLACPSHSGAAAAGEAPSS